MMFIGNGITTFNNLHQIAITVSIAHLPLAYYSPIAHFDKGIVTMINEGIPPPRHDEPSNFKKQFQE
jgi:hypothetical protein